MLMMKHVQGQPAGRTVTHDAALLAFLRRMAAFDPQQQVRAPSLGSIYQVGRLTHPAAAVLCRHSVELARPLPGRMLFGAAFHGPIYGFVTPSIAIHLLYGLR